MIMAILVNHQLKYEKYCFFGNPSLLLHASTYASINLGAF